MQRMSVHKRDLCSGKVTQQGAHVKLADLTVVFIAHVSHKQLPGMSCQLLSDQSMH